MINIDYILYIIKIMTKYYKCTKKLSSRAEYIYGIKIILPEQTKFEQIVVSINNTLLYKNTDIKCKIHKNIFTLPIFATKNKAFPVGKSLMAQITISVLFSAKYKPNEIYFDCKYIYLYNEDRSIFASTNTIFTYNDICFNMENMHCRITKTEKNLSHKIDDNWDTYNYIEPCKVENIA